jgi:hypothetical protein
MFLKPASMLPSVRPQHKKTGLLVLGQFDVVDTTPGFRSQEETTKALPGTLNPALPNPDSRILRLTGGQERDRLQILVHDKGAGGGKLAQGAKKRLNRGNEAKNLLKAKGLAFSGAQNEPNFQGRKPRSKPRRWPSIDDL